MLHILFGGSTGILIWISQRVGFVSGVVIYRTKFPPPYPDYRLPFGVTYRNDYNGKSGFPNDPYYEQCAAIAYRKEGMTSN